jgi:DNA polymerase III delta subunit
VRYFNRAAFLNQIKNGKSAGAACRTYWVAVSHDYERAQIVDEILHLVGPGRGNIQKWTELDLLSLGSYLQTPNLFGDEPVALLENAETIPKSDSPRLEKLFPREFGYLICSAKSKCAVSSVVENVGVVLDLLTEKPWEREKRMQQTLENLVHTAGKTIAPNAISSLMEGQDLEEGILAREVEKLICYSGDLGHITAADVAAICTPNRSFAVWQTAEKVVWEKKGSLDEEHFHALLPALRSQLQLGLKIATLLAENAPQEEWSSLFPKVFPKTLEKRTRDASPLGVRYFARGIEALFDIELKSRTGSGHLGALLDFFQCTLYAGV